ncbi:MAG: Putative phage major capsid protein [Candidatus Midichloria mitochondrii]|uniref:Putative phage major capsid protein n=1 Tax=Midichloria mitochondrii (strain IricVA) TaxID=696127 RepID=F7XWR0_MIDMI|nr:hypothetical protein [Candidatus Midichloria mitochondrii]AEI89109.1 putative phage major capsid protein [Candidatus Midichloria mitochondrii IricVA]MDJ1256816.1 hypothetical protein [Candidatus Midichloria mitochondrii]MDJ1288550.1 hypothetical protein [Candidatus Midichloria mitochondrii]MDJ1299416.1 hypothetical protein [Candidatus Midichloria mitochondrii]MDJ1313489.1 hypothetical protein [Candidatus Midichloria mitochondrii]
MSTSDITNRLNQINDAWHNLTQTNDEITNTDRDNVDPLTLDKISKLNNFIDKQQEEINSLKTAIA